MQSVNSNTATLSHIGITPFVRQEEEIYQPLPQIVVPPEVKVDLEMGIERYVDKLASWRDNQGINPENVLTLVPRQTGWIYVQSLAEAFKRCAERKGIYSFHPQPVNIGRWLTERYGDHEPIEYWQTDQIVPYLLAILNDEDFNNVILSVQSLISKLPNIEGVICLDDQFTTGKTNFALMEAVSKAVQNDGLITMDEALEQHDEEILEDYVQPENNGYNDVRLGKLLIGRVFITEKSSKQNVVDASFPEAIRSPNDIPPYCVDKMIMDLLKRRGYVDDKKVEEINSREQAVAVGNRIALEHNYLQNELNKQTYHEDIPNPYLYLERVYGPRILSLSTKFREALEQTGERMSF